MQERRKYQRNRTYLAAQVAYNRRCSTMDCLVRNMSQDGARLVFAALAAVPAEFDLSIPQKGDSRRARVIWRREREAGIQFVNRRAATVFSIEAARRIRKLEKEKAALRTRLARLSEPV